MEALAVAIFLSTVLFLVDKNKKWPAFWRSLAVLVLLSVVGVAGTYIYARHSATQASTHDEFEQYRRK